MENQLEPTKFSRLKKMVAALDTRFGDNDVDLDFEVIVGSLYPHIWENMQKALKDQYTKGYIDGLKDGEEE